MNQTTLGRQLKGEQALSAKLIEGFLHVFPDISAEWLLRGEGNIYKSNSGSLQFEAAITPSQDESIWKAKYEAIKECYDIFASTIGGLSKRVANKIVTITQIQSLVSVLYGKGVKTIRRVNVLMYFNGASLAFKRSDSYL